MTRRQKTQKGLVFSAAQVPSGRHLIQASPEKPLLLVMRPRRLQTRQRCRLGFRPWVCSIEKTNCSSWAWRVLYSVHVIGPLYLSSGGKKASLIVWLVLPKNSSLGSLRIPGGAAPAAAGGPGGAPGSRGP